MRCDAYGVVLRFSEVAEAAIGWVSTHHKPNTYPSFAGSHAPRARTPIGWVLTHHKPNTCPGLPRRAVAASARNLTKPAGLTHLQSRCAEAPLLLSFGHVELAGGLQELERREHADKVALRVVLRSHQPKPRWLGVLEQVRHSVGGLDRMHAGQR